MLQAHPVDAPFQNFSANETSVVQHTHSTLAISLRQARDCQASPPETPPYFTASNVIRHDNPKAHHGYMHTRTHVRVSETAKTIEHNAVNNRVMRELGWVVVEELLQAGKELQEAGQ
jgi:hypothetical protein